nr:hypothetical protein [uncultured Arsenicibacter sp.]
MKHIFTLVLTLLCLSACKKEPAEPAEPASTSKGLVVGLNSPGQTAGQAVATDGSDNFIVASVFGGALAGHNLTATGTADTHLAKYDKNGVLLWERTAGGAGISTTPMGVKTDAQGNIYVLGYFGGTGSNLTATFGTKTVTAKSSNDAFLAKYDPTGAIQWVLSLGNTTGVTDERACDLTIDGAGNLYLTGAFSGTVNFNPLGQTARTLMVPETTSSIFLARYDTNGQNQLVTYINAGLTSVPNEAFSAVDMDIYGNVIWSGNFRGMAQLSYVTLNSAGNTDVFVGCFRTWDLGINWIQRFGGSDQELVAPGGMRVNARSIVLTGQYAGTSQIGNTQLMSQSAGNIFVTAYSPDGPHQWAVGLPGSTGISSGTRVGFDQSDNVYVAGYFRGTVNFNPKASAPLVAKGTTDAGDAFLAKLGYDGAYVWARSFGVAQTGAANLTRSNGLATDRSGNAIITGSFYGKSVDFDPSDLAAYLSSAGQDDAFTGKYTSEGALWTK